MAPLIDTAAGMAPAATRLTAPEGEGRSLEMVATTAGRWPDRRPDILPGHTSAVGVARTFKDVHEALPSRQ